VELRLEDVNPLLYEAYGESVGDIIEVMLKSDMIPTPDDEALPDLPARL